MGIQVSGLPVFIYSSVCGDGIWSCTDNECPGICSTWGEGHFQTFDRLNN